MVLLFVSGMTRQSGGVCCSVVNVCVLPCLSMYRRGVTSRLVSSHCLHLAAEWWMGRSAPEEGPPADGLHASSRSPEWFTLTQLGRFAGSVQMFRDYPPARQENCIRKRLIQFNPETKVRRKTNHWSSQVQRGDDHSAGVLSEKWWVECQQKANSSTRTCFIKCVKSRCSFWHLCNNHTLHVQFVWGQCVREHA